MSRSDSNTEPSLLPPAVLALLWALAGLLNAFSLSWLETLNAAGLLIALAAVAVIGGAKRLAQTAGGRLWTTGVFVASILLLSPAFHPGLAASLPDDLLACLSIFHKQSPMPSREIFLPALGFATQLLFAILLSFWRIAPPEAGRQDGAAERLERFFSSRMVRLNLVLFSLVIVLLELWMSQTPFRAALTRGAALALALCTLRALLAGAGKPAFVRTLNAGLVCALALALGAGAYSYSRLLSGVNAGNELLAKSQPDEAGKLHQQARELNQLVCAAGPELNIQTQWAKFFESHGAFEQALSCWRVVADQRHLDYADFGPILRVQCKLGDSITAWRRLVFKGFAAISGPELIPGIKALADAPKCADPRAKLLAALLSWELQEPKEERKRRLDEVQRLVPNEPSSSTLLARLGSAEKTPLWLPQDLLVAERPSFQSALGTLEEVGAVQTVVTLDPGHWEMELHAHGTPLHQEWPIIRVELNGYEIGRTQVNRAKDYAVPFTFEVKRGDLYLLRLVFENMSNPHTEEMYEGHVALRGLVVRGITFQRAK